MQERHSSYRVETWDILQHLFGVKNISDHTLRFVATCSGKIDINRLRRAVNLSSEAFPLIRSRFNEATFRPCWEDQGYSADDMVSLVETTTLDESIRRFVCKSVDALSGPQLMIGVIRGTEFDTLCISMNHMLCDAAGFKDYLYILSEMYSNIENKRVYETNALGNRRLRQVFESFSVRDRMKILFSKNSMDVNDPACFELEGDAATPFTEIRTIEQENFRRLKAYAKEHGATVNDVFLTAYMRILFEDFGCTMSVPCVVDLRKYLPNREAKGICNLITGLVCDIGPEIGSTFEQTLIKVKAAMDKEKSNISRVKSLVVLERIINFLPYKLVKHIFEKNYSNAHIEFTNIGILDKERLSFGNANVARAYMTGSIKYSPSFELAVSTFDDRATFCVSLFATSDDRNTVSTFLNKLIIELQTAM